jgi:protein-arginine kinase activator protein McsA
MNKCPITGNNCLKFKGYHVTNIDNKNLEKDISVCEDCLCNLDKKNIQKEKSEFVCSCGLSIEELLIKSRMGCAKCYEVFEKPMQIALEKIHRTPDVSMKEIGHVGRVPISWKKRQAQETDPKKFILELKQKLAICIKEENYKLANELKYIIKGFESLLEKVDEFKNDKDQQELIKNQVFEFIYLFREKSLEK